MILNPVTSETDFIRKLFGDFFPFMSGLTIDMSDTILNPAGFTAAQTLSDGSLFGLPGECVVMSTGNASHIIYAINGTNGLNWSGLGGTNDPDLLALLATTGSGSASLYDVIKIKFSFGMSTNLAVNFRFIFGSNEYPGYIHSSFNDVFGFFVNGSNIALVPGTTSLITINSINDEPTAPPSVNPSFYRSNRNGDFPTTAGGITTVIDVMAPLVVGSNTIKLAIADMGDAGFDSFILLQASFRRLIEIEDEDLEGECSEIKYSVGHRVEKILNGDVQIHNRIGAVCNIRKNLFVAGMLETPEIVLVKDNRVICSANIGAIHDVDGYEICGLAVNDTYSDIFCMMWDKETKVRIFRVALEKDNMYVRYDSPMFLPQAVEDLRPHDLPDWMLLPCTTETFCEYIFPQPLEDIINAETSKALSETNAIGNLLGYRPYMASWKNRLVIGVNHMQHLRLGFEIRMEETSLIPFPLSHDNEGDPMKRMFPDEWELPLSFFTNVEYDEHNMWIWAWDPQKEIMTLRMRMLFRNPVLISTLVLINTDNNVVEGMLHVGSSGLIRDDELDLHIKDAQNLITGLMVNEDCVHVGLSTLRDSINIDWLKWGIPKYHFPSLHYELILYTITDGNRPCINDEEFEILYPNYHRFQVQNVSHCPIYVRVTVSHHHNFDTVDDVGNQVKNFTLMPDEYSDPFDVFVYGQGVGGHSGRSCKTKLLVLGTYCDPAWVWIGEVDPDA